MLYSNIIRGSPQHHAQPSSSSSSFSSSTITATAASSQRVSRDDYSNGGGGGGGGGDEDGDGSGTRMATASRQRAKQALKKMRSEQAAQTGRDDLRQLAAGLLRNEAAGGGERWALLLELADLAKRENDFELARSLYRKAIKQKPKKSLCWLEYAKMEDECGETRHCLALLKRGLASCPLCESMMIKAIKIEEKLQNVAGARALLALLKDQPLEKTWRVVLEGALLEARCGNATVARKAFQYLIRNVPWYGPIYQEAFRFEERYEEYARAIRIVEQGLKENPKYGPLWFSAIRIYEKVAPAKLAPTLALASDILLKDLKWKVFFEQAQIEARAGRLREARSAYARAAEHCPGNLVWKVWLGGARTELCAGNADTARELIAQALASVPAKMRPIVVLDQARLEEYSGCLAAARAVLDAAKISEKQEWKIFLERILLEIRIRDKATAYRQALESLHVHAGTGRLWALKIQLTDADSADASVERQKAVFKEALREVPKSGEVWCEGARIYIKRHKHAKARMCLEFAAQFTPQYGDSFIEYLRNEFIETGKFTDPCPLERVPHHTTQHNSHYY